MIDNFFEGVTILIKVYAMIFLRSSKNVSLCYTIINSLFYSLKLLLIVKILTETLLRIPFSVIGRPSSVSNPHWLQGKYAKFHCHRLHLVIFYSIIECFLCAFLGSLGL